MKYLSEQDEQEVAEDFGGPPGDAHSLRHRLASLQKYWECKAEECERWEKHYEASDPVTSQQSKASKEVYRTCIRELLVSLANESVSRRSCR